jgi:hypothetical protein
MVLKLLRDFLLSFIHYRPIGPFLFCGQVLFLFYFAQMVSLDLFDISFNNFYTKELTGARFVTRVLQVYLLKSTLKRFMDILDYKQLGAKHITLIGIILFGPMWVGSEPILLWALVLIPGKGHYLNELKSFKLYYNELSAHDLQHHI